MRVVKRKRYQPSIKEIYEQAKLTPVLVVIGGSHSYRMDNPQNIDYFGYHIEENDDITIGGGQWRGRYWNTTEPEIIPRIRTFGIDSIVPRLRGDLGDEAAMYCMDNWIWHTAILETEQARQFRTTWVYPFLNPVFAIHYAQYAKALYIAYNNIKPGKIWDQILRIALTAKHLASTGELNCDFRWLKYKYDSNTLEYMVQLLEEIIGQVT